MFKRAREVTNSFTPGACVRISSSRPILLRINQLFEVVEHSTIRYVAPGIAAAVRGD
jgi:hypothetical protein